jgi:hypothetical protein
MTPRFYIFAGNMHQARELAMTMKLNRPDWCYVASMESVWGLRDVVVLRYGTWVQREDGPGIMAILRPREITVLDVRDV